MCYSVAAESSFVCFEVNDFLVKADEQTFEGKRANVWGKRNGKKRPQGKGNGSLERDGMGY